MENTESRKQNLLPGRRKRLKWILLAACVVVLILAAVLIFVLVNRNNSKKLPVLELTYQGVTLELGQRIDPEELAQQWGAEIVDPKDLEHPPDVEDGTLYVSIDTDSASFTVVLLKTGSDYVVTGWCIGSGVEYCGLKPGDPMEDVREMFPGVDFWYGSSGKGYFFFYVDREGNVLTSAQMWEKWNEANEAGGDALERLQKEYTQIEIYRASDGTISSISVG